MDKTIEIIVVVMIALLVASILIFLVQDRTGNFGDFLDGQQDSAQCELWKTQYQRTGDDSIKQKAVDNECSGAGGWTSDASDSGGAGSEDSIDTEDYTGPLDKNP